MRKYWLRILIGAFAIFAIGMIGVTLVRTGIAKVNSVVDSDDPLTIPLAFVPFILNGERLGNLEEVVIHRDTPRQVRSVELQVDLSDSLLARGLSGCRLVANFENDPEKPGLNIRTSDRDRSAFSCLPGDSTPAGLVEFGEAIFQPGEVRVPLYLQQELVTELHEALAEDSTAAESRTDSLAELAELRSDSAVEALAENAGSLGRAGRRLGDSLREAARRQVDSAQVELGRMADTVPRR
ncbi:MAG: hypothetical protein H0W29_15890 [Gemmatimonadales bacterium]|nr:hypothetical protein [Gemmatimonadales bacterium]